MSGLFIVASFISFFEWNYLRRRKVRFITYIKVFSILLLSFLYVGIVFSMDENSLYTPNYLLNKVFTPLQNFLTLKGLRR